MLGKLNGQTSFHQSTFSGTFPPRRITHPSEVPGMDRNLEQRSKQNLKKALNSPLASILPSVSFYCQRQTRSLLVHTSSSSSLPGGAHHLGYIQGNASAQWVAGKPCRPYTVRWVQTMAVKRRIAIANEVRAVSLASHSCTKSGQSRRRLASCSRAKHHHDHPSSRSVCVPCGCECVSVCLPLG